MNFHTMSARETAEYIKKQPIDTHKKNRILAAKRKNIFERFLQQFSDFMIIILLLAAGVSLAATILSGEGDFADPIIILVIVILNACLGVIEEYKADNAIEALKKMSSPSATLRRNGREITVSAEDVRTGDILLLRPGSMISADARLLSAIDAETDESALTGEAMPVSKNPESILADNTPLAERSNMLFAGTSLLSGKAEAIVTAIGMDTEIGKIAAMLHEQEDEPTPLQKKLAQTGKYLGIGALIICAVIFGIGVLKKLPVFMMFLTSVSLAVAAIPEGLPAIVTVVLAIGVQRMAKKNAIVKHLSAVETLGSATVICADKTGTLTQNLMRVAKTTGEDKLQLFEMASLCCDGSSNPTEKAILDEAARLGITKAETNRRFKRVSELPFSSKRKMMSVLVDYYGKNRIITKGAAEILITKCTHFIENGTRTPLTQSKINSILRDTGDMCENSLRVIGVAYKDTSSSLINESGLTFIGLIGMVDPPRPEVKCAVAECKRAGIKPVMITGDNKVTALAIARETGFEGAAVCGSEIAAKTDEQLTDYSIFARVTPADKMRIVKAFKAQGNIVAMTGDGVNDAPALKAADIGCSMGQKGTDVAKEASDLVLADDNFASIVAAVKEGRGIFENIRKSVKFLLSSNIGEIITIFLGMLFGWEPPLLAMQLLWVNLVTDSLPALALGLDPVDSQIMLRPPRNPKESLFAGGMWASICLEGSLIGALALTAFSIGRCFFDTPGAAPTIGRTMAFCVLSISQLFHAFNMRSEESVLNSKLFKNPVLIASLIIGIILQISVVNVEFFANVFKVAVLSSLQWGVVFALAILPIAVVELQKWVSSKSA